MKLFFSLVVFFLSCSGAHAEIINIDSTQLARLAGEGVPVIDIRTEGEWQSSGLIAGSKPLTFFDSAGRSNPPQWLEKVRAHARADQPLILICRSGNRSMAAARFLSDQAGYSTVYNVSKGIAGWIGDGRPTTPFSSTGSGASVGARR